MRHLLILSSLSLLFTGAALAGSEGPCASFAKYGAMRASKVEPHRAEAVSTYGLSHLRTKNEKSLYFVSVNEGARDSLGYYVTVAAEGSSCKILDVAKTSVKDF